MMKKYFITGLVILLPLALTLMIVVFMFNFLTEPFAGIVKSVLTHYNLPEHGFLFFSADQVQKLISQFIILLILFFFTAGLGLVARWFFVHYLIRFWDYMLNRIPVVRTIYKTIQDIINTIFTSNAGSFKKVVMVPYPNEHIYSIGLVTRDNIPSIPGSNDMLVAVFIPTTPNPTSGYLVMFKQKDLIYLDMKVEEAFKYVISCGVISSPFNVISVDAPI